MRHRSAITTLAMISVILGTGITAIALTQIPPLSPGAPHCAALAIHTPSAKLPPIGPFDTIVNTVPDNPFFFHEPPVLPPPPARASVEIQNQGATSATTPPAPPPPPLNLPKAPDLRTDAPICHGLVTVGTVQVALVTMPGQTGLHQMTAGTSIPRTTGNPAKTAPWTLLGITAGNLAHWRDPAGSEQTFPIANGLDAGLANHDRRHGRPAND